VEVADEPVFGDRQIAPRVLAGDRHG
jgi:hypothetical protein